MLTTRAALIVLTALAATTSPLTAQRFRAGDGLDQLPRYGVPRDTLLFMAILRAEDARGRGPDGMAPILAGLEHDESDIRIAAARAIGRLERTNLVPTLVPLLTDVDRDVRTEAVNAVGQAVFNQNTELATRTLITRLEHETDEMVRGVLIQTLGRLPYQSADRRRAAEHAMVLASPTVRNAALISVARGWDSFVRNAGRGYAYASGVGDYLRVLTTTRVSDDATPSTRSAMVRVAPAVRALGLGAAVGAGVADTDILRTALGDDDWKVRRAAALGLTLLAPLTARTELILVAQRDPHFAVRLEGVRAYARQATPAPDCDPILSAVQDPSAHVALAAIDALATCGAAATPVLTGLVTQPWTALDWHRPAHALVTLARVAPENARGRLQTFAAAEVSWVRLYAARAAAILEAEGLLQRLAGDPDANVREAALRGLIAVSGHAADEIYLSNLETTDYNLLLRVAAALEGSDHPAVPVRLLQRLGILTAAGRETSRDVRLALLQRIGELGTAPLTDGLRPYLRDFDPVIARATAEILTRWNDTTYDADPQALPATPFPALDDLRRTDGTARVHLQMRRGGEIVLRTLPWESPTNVMRLYRLALARYFDGLTFHRVVPNFVIQGGSPGANEYVGDGPFTRDEVGRRSHARGTVGISTRGRDTGDGQIFVNLVDNHRLDHNYTIIAEVVEGLEVVDSVLEGDVIERVVVRLR